PRARFRQEVAWPRGVALDLAAELRDVDVQVVRLPLVGRPPDLAQNQRVRHETADVERKEAQELELVGGERQELPVLVDRALVELDPQVTNLHDRIVRGLGSTQARAQARKQLVDAEG